MSSSGWIKMKDPNTGMYYYANRITRQTQWEAPPGFVDESTTSNVNGNSGRTTRSAQFNVTSSGFGSFKNTTSTSYNVTASSSSTYTNGDANHTNGSVNNSFDQICSNGNEDSLPPNWEKLFDKASGKHFYVDHVNKVTTWERPVSTTATTTTNGNNYNYNASNPNKSGLATGFGIIPKHALERNNSNSQNSPKINMTRHTSHSTSSATSPSWQYYGSNPPPSTALGPSSSSSMLRMKHSSSSSIHHHDDVSTKYYQEHKIDFTVTKVPDRLRPACPSCDVIFSMPLKRRHHCRVCQDVFCDTCSSHRVDLPFDGEEFIKPVRVCDLCHLDVEHGNFFSMRRYLTPLQLYDGEDINEGGVEFSSKNVCAALSGLAADLESLLLDSTSFTEKVTIPVDILVPAICNHLTSHETCTYAIKVLSTLLALGNVVGEQKFLVEVYKQERNVFEDLMKLLEWSGSSTKTLAVQEQTAQTFFYLTDSKVITEILRLGEGMGEQWSDIILARLDVHRALRSMIDHSTQTMSPSLQRWSAACICNLIAEDYRRSCEAINDAMAVGSNELKYQSFIKEMVASGGVMMLSSLVSSEDADTRNYTMKALSATIETSREVNVQLGVLSEAYGIQSISGSNYSDTSIIDGIVSAGVCSPLTQLLLSADDAVASMGCYFARSLVFPLLTNPLGSALPCYHRLLSVNSIVKISNVINEDGLGTYRKAALQLSLSDGILSGLVHLVSDNTHTSSRPIDLKRVAMEILAAITVTLSFLDSKVKAMGSSIEGNHEWEELKHNVGMAFTLLEEEGIAEAVVLAYSSTSISSLNTIRDSPASQLREAASLVMSATASSSSTIASYYISCNIVARLINTAGDNGYATVSARGEWTSRRLAMLEAIAMILVQGWTDIQTQSYHLDESTDNYEHGNPAPLSLLLESLDAGIIPLVNRLLDARVEDGAEKAYRDVRLQIALCHIIAALFGIGQCDKTSIGFSRIFEAIGNSQYLIPMTVSLLGSTISATQKHSNGSNNQLPIPELLEANLLALGSMCGSRFCSFSSVGLDGDKAVLGLNILRPEDKDVFSCQFEEICMSVCEIITKQSFLTSCLVGVYGEGSIMPTLRLTSAVAENGPERTHLMLANSGLLVPTADMLRDALVAGDYYVFASCVSLTSICGSQLTSNSENSRIQSLRGCVQMLANVLTIDEGDGNDRSRVRILSSLKRKCVFAIERLSSNSGLWVTIVSHFIPSVSEYLNTKVDDQSKDYINSLAAGLRVIIRVISIPVHASKIAQTNIASSLSELICDIDVENSTTMTEIEMLSLQILNTLTLVSIKQQSDGSHEVDALNAACTVLIRSDSENLSPDIASKMKLALDILLNIAIDLENIDENMVSSSSRIIGFVETIGMHTDLIKRLCATLLHLGEMNERSNILKVEPLYGPTIILFEGECGGFTRSLDAAIYLMYRIALFTTLVETSFREEFWHHFFLEDEKAASIKTKTATTTAACAIFLNILNDEASGICVPKNTSKLDYYKSFSLPLVRERLLIGLHGGVEEFASMKNDPEIALYFQTFLQSYNMTQSCLGLCNSPLLLDSAFQVLEITLSEFSDSLIESVIADGVSLTALFNLLSISPKNVEVKTKPEIIRIFAAVTLSAAGKLGILGAAVKQNGLRSLAIASLSTACIMEDHDSAECLAEDLTGECVSMSTLCLRAIVDILSGHEEKELTVQMSSAEAKAISFSLGKKLSSMVLDHFVKCESGENSLDDRDSVARLPEVMIICALASFQESLITLCSVGGLEALSLVASQGIETAILALHHACKIDLQSVLKVDGHISVMQVIAYHSEEISVSVKEACMDFLAAICSNSRKGKEEVAIADECSACISFASKCITKYANIFGNMPPSDSTGDLLDTMTEKAPNSSDTMEISDMNVVLSCISLLSSILRVKNARMEIIRNPTLKSALQIILENSPSYIAKFLVSNFFSSLSRYAAEFDEESEFSVENLSSILLLCFNPNPKQQSRYSIPEMVTPLFGNFSKMHYYNDNLVVATACTAFERMLPYISKELLHDIISELVKKFSDIIKYEMKATKKIAIKTRNSGLLACNISLLLYLSSTETEVKDELRSKSLLTDLVRLILLNPAEKLVEGKKDSEDDIKALKVEKSNWNCCLMHCLQCMAMLSVEPLDEDNDKNSSWDEIISSAQSEIQMSISGKHNTHMVVSKQSASQMTQLSTISVLNKYWKDGFDSGISIAAKKIIDNLDLT